MEPPNKILKTADFDVLELVTLDRALEPFAVVNDVTPAKRCINEDPPISSELHKLRLCASLRGARCITQIREGRFRSEEDFMKEYYAIARELQLTPVERLQWRHQVHHLLPKCCGGSDEPTNLAPFIFSSHFILHVILATFFTTQSHWSLGHGTEDVGWCTQSFSNDRLSRTARCG